MKAFIQKVIKGLRYLRHYGFREFVIRLREKMEAEHVPYEPWYERHKATEEQLKKQRQQAEKWTDAPKISIVVPLYRTPEQFLREMIASVQAQSYGNWELCLADGSEAFVIRNDRGSIALWAEQIGPVLEHEGEYRIVFVLRP